MYDSPSPCTSPSAPTTSFVPESIVLAQATPISAAFKLIVQNAKHAPTPGPAFSLAGMFFTVSA